jgi:hypothetical protein
MASLPHPLGSFHLFGLDDHRRDLTLSVILMAAVVATRLWAFPVTIWEQDEAYFAAAVIDFEPLSGAPHPPWFPLWIALGKLLYVLGSQPEDALRMVSLAFSVWIVFPLTSLWSTLVPRRLAVGSAVLFVMAPGPWFLAGRAFSGTAATGLLVAALAFWAQARSRVGWLTAGSVISGLAVLIRPQLLPAVAGSILVIGLRRPPQGFGRAALGFLCVLAVGAACLTLAAGGVAPLWSAFEAHLDYHVGQLDSVNHDFAGSGFARSLGGAFGAMIWITLAGLGLVALIRVGRWQVAAPIVVGSLLPVLLVIHGLSNPAHARYAVPVLALSCGLVVNGLLAVFRRWTWTAICAAGLASAATVGPQLADYRTAVSPPVAALELAVDTADTHGSILIIDPSLHAFWLLREASRPIEATVLIDHAIEIGFQNDELPYDRIYLVDAGNNVSLNGAFTLFRLTANAPLIRMLSQDRFVDVIVATRKAPALDENRGLSDLRLPTGSVGGASASPILGGRPSAGLSFRDIVVETLRRVGEVDVVVGREAIQDILPDGLFGRAPAARLGEKTDGQGDPDISD